METVRSLRSENVGGIYGSVSSSALGGKKVLPLYDKQECEENRSWKLILSLIVFTTAYCIQPMLVDCLRYQGAAKPTTLIYLLPHYLAMVCVGFIPSFKNKQTLSIKAWKKAAFVSAVDAAHQIAEKAGLLFAGSAVYIVVGSSSIVWTAVISAIILKSSFSTGQWSSLLFICVGLAVKASSISFRLDNDEFIGCALTTVASILHGFTFVTNEKLMTSGEKISGPSLVFMMGTLNLTMLLVWTCLWTVPQFELLILANIRSHGGDITVVLQILLGLFACGLIHSCTLWYILQQLGAVTSGVIKVFKTATVLIMSHYMFCNLQASQCLTPMKSFSAMICIVGVIMYSVATMRALRVRQESEEEKQPLTACLSREENRGGEEYSPSSVAGHEDGYAGYPEAMSKAYDLMKNEQYSSIPPVSSAEHFSPVESPFVGAQNILQKYERIHQKIHISQTNHQKLQDNSNQLHQNYTTENLTKQEDIRHSQFYQHKLPHGSSSLLETEPFSTPPNYAKIDRNHDKSNQKNATNIDQHDAQISRNNNNNQKTNTNHSPADEAVRSRMHDTGNVHRRNYTDDNQIDQYDSSNCKNGKKSQNFEKYRTSDEAEPDTSNAEMNERVKNSEGDKPEGGDRFEQNVVDSEIRRAGIVEKNEFCLEPSVDVACAIGQPVWPIPEGSLESAWDTGVPLAASQEHNINAAQKSGPKNADRKPRKKNAIFPRRGRGSETVLEPIHPNDEACVETCRELCGDDYEANCVNRKDFGKSKKINLCFENEGNSGNDTNSEKSGKHEDHEKLENRQHSADNHGEHQNPADNEYKKYPNIPLATIQKKPPNNNDPTPSTISTVTSARHTNLHFPPIQADLHIDN